MTDDEITKKLQELNAYRLIMPYLEKLLACCNCPYFHSYAEHDNCPRIIDEPDTKKILKRCKE